MLATFNNIPKHLKAREAELVAQLEGHTQQQLKKLCAQREEVEILQTQRENCVHFVRESIRSGSPGDVLKMKAGVVKQVREPVHTFDPHTLEPCEQATTSFTRSCQLDKGCREFGKVCHIDLPHISIKYPKYQPTVGGAHQLHVRVGGAEVKGSLFPMTVKTPSL